MSSSSEMVDSGRFSGKKTARALERSSFTQTCNLLSQYMKEKGTLGGDLNLGINNGMAPPTTMNLFPVVEKSGQYSTRNLNSMKLFPQQAGFGPTVSNEEHPKKPQPETAQMTIFYGGQVIVFNDFPADKAKEIMLLASKGSSHSQKPDMINDLPIARKASLTRFLEKRKDRIIAKAPYQISNSTGAHSKPAESKSWLGLMAAQSPLQLGHQL